MTIDGFGSMAGQLATAIGTPDSWQAKVGKAGTDMTQAKILAMAKKKDMDNLMSNMRLLAAGKFPDAEGAVHAALGGPTIAAARGAEASAPAYVQNKLLDIKPANTPYTYSNAFNLAGPSVGMNKSNSQLGTPMENFDFANWGQTP
jgi:propanediol dehydratase large subunit